MDDWQRTSATFRQYLITTGRSEGTASTYVSNLSLFARWCYKYECRPEVVDRAAVRSWLTERMAAVSSARAHTDLAALRCFYAWTIEDGLRDDDPTAGVRVKRTKALPTEPLREDDLDTLLASCTVERDRMILLMLAATGMRISELASLRAEDIDWRKGQIKVTGKGDKERLVAPNPDVLNRLHAFMGMFPAGPVWLSQRSHKPLSAHQIRKIVYDIAERAKLQGIHPHRLRSYFATQYIEQFADIQALQGVMGHESIETTARYSETTRQRRGLDQMRRMRGPSDRLVG